jgi:uncharacterized protein YecE (DUF72 family)
MAAGEQHMNPAAIYVGIAGWSIPSAQAELFPGSGTHLERLSQRLNAAEINTTFYRPHQPKTYTRWAESTPPDFRFSVKARRTMTHEKRLTEPGLIADFLIEVQHLGDKLGPLLFQFPPSLGLNLKTATVFFETLRSQWSGAVVCEPRHRSWFTQEAESIFIEYKISRAAADPSVVPAASQPGGWSELVYFRLHGSPEMYTSPYTAEFLVDLSGRLRSFAQSGVETWCIFDNTAAFFAQLNALELTRLLSSEVQA